MKLTGNRTMSRSEARAEIRVILESVILESVWLEAWAEKVFG